MTGNLFIFNSERFDVQQLITIKIVENKTKSMEIDTIWALQKF